MRVGLLVNPWAGVGGTVALKGSDGAEIRQQALALGAVQKAPAKAALALKELLASSVAADIDWYTAAGQLGGELLENQVCSRCTLFPHAVPAQTEAEHSRAIVQWLLEQQVDVILFAGGDGTARDVCSVVQQQIPVIGVPAGVKIHSGVFAVTPHAAGEVLMGLLTGALTELRTEEVRDIDEQAFREGKVRARHYGEMRVPVAGEFMQHVKVGGIESEELVLNEIAEYAAELMQPDICYFFGSGQTLATLMSHWGWSSTLLGIDAVLNGEVIKADCTEQDLLNLLEQHPCHAFVSIIGGQGHVIGRGNPQLSSAVLKKLGKANFHIIATQAKLKSLAGRPLLIDSGDYQFDLSWAGLIPLISGYNAEMIYPLRAL